MMIFEVVKEKRGGKQALGYLGLGYTQIHLK